MGAPPGVTKPFDPKVAAYVLGGCALAIVIAVLSKSWMSGRGDAGVGPLGVSFRGIDAGWKGAPGDIQAIGYLALIAGLACAGICGWMAFLCFSNTPHKFPKFQIVNGILGVAAFATTFFPIRLMIEWNKDLSISWAPVFGIGGVITAGVFIRKLKNYWPGVGTMPWPVAVAVTPQQGGWQQPPIGGPPMGPPPGGPPMGAPPMGAPPMGAPPQGWGAPMGPPPGAPPMGPPPGAAPMGPAPAAPAYGAPMGPAPAAPAYGAPMGPAPAAPAYGAPAFGGAPPNPYAAPTGPMPPHGHAPPTGNPNAPNPTPSIGAAPHGPPNAARPDQYAATMMPGPTTSSAPAPNSNAKTIMGAAAPQLKELLKQPPGGAPQAQAQPQGGAQAQSKFCGRCGKPMQFVAQYQRWFCQGCQQYA